MNVIVQDLDTLGDHRVVFRCDNEPSILALLWAVKLAWTGHVVQETSAEGDPQSNGAAESSVTVVKRYVRSIKLAVESASGVEVPADHDVLTWFVSYATSMHRRFLSRSRRQDSMRKKCGLLLPWHSSVRECGGCLCSHPTVVWALWIHILSNEGTWNRWMDQTQCLSTLPVVW